MVKVYAVRKSKLHEPELAFFRREAAEAVARTVDYTGGDNADGLVLELPLLDGEAADDGE